MQEVRTMAGPIPWQPIRDDGFTVLLRDLHTMILHDTATRERILWMVEAMQRINGDEPCTLIGDI